MTDEVKPAVVVEPVEEEVIQNKQFESSDGRIFSLIPPHSPELKEKIAQGCKAGKILAWEKTMDCGFHVERIRILDVKDMDVDTLKNLNLWDALSAEVKTAVENRNVIEKEKVVARMEVARAGRKQKYPNIPKEITCITCKSVQTVVPSMIAKRVEKLGVLLVDFINNYQCQKCHPTKGRRKKGTNNE